MKLKLIILITICCGIDVFGQNGTIEGEIRSNDSTVALSNVSVYLSNTNLGASTNGSGSYSIENIPEGNYLLTISCVGYFTIKKEIKVGKGELINENFTMTETISTLAEVTITGGDVGIRDIPGSVHYISPKELQKFGYTDINRILRSVPGVNVQEEDGFGLFPNIGLRGTGVERNTKITVMEDGVLIAPAPYSAPAAYYFPTIGRMQGVEVIKGSSQIKYGPYTTGGAINLISTGIPNEFSGKINLNGGSFGGRNVHAVVGNKHKNFAYLVETFQQGSNGFKKLDNGINRGFQNNTGFIKQDYLAKFRINTKLDAKIFQSLTLKLGQSNGNINETYLGLTQEDFISNPFQRYAGSQMDNIKTSQSQLSLTHKVKFSKTLDFTTVIYRTNFSRNWYKLDRLKDSSGNEIKIAKLLDSPVEFGNVFDILRGTSSIFNEALFVKANNRSYYSKGIQTKLNLTFKTKKIKHNIDLGFRLHQDQIDRFQWFDEYSMENSVMLLTNPGIHGTESNRIETANAFATYLQYKLKIGKFTATPGLRYENITQEREDFGKTDPERYGLDLSVRSNKVDVIIPGIGLDYRFSPYLSTFLGVHKGFAPPGSKDELEPEESINYELGSRFSKNGLSGQTVIFYSDYKNLLGTDLEASGGGGTNEQFNGGEVKTYGVEFNMSYDLLFSKRKSTFNLPVTLSYTYTDSKFQNDFDSDFEGWGNVTAGDQFPYLANNQFTISLGLEHHKFEFNISGKYMDEMRTKPGQGKMNFDEKTDSYFILDAGATYKAHKNVSFFTNATNLTNQVYVVARRPAGLRPGMPRSFNVGLKANF